MEIGGATVADRYASQREVRPLPNGKYGTLHDTAWFVLLLLANAGAEQGWLSIREVARKAGHIRPEHAHDLIEKLPDSTRYLQSRKTPDGTVLWQALPF